MKCFALPLLLQCTIEGSETLQGGPVCNLEEKIRIKTMTISESIARIRYVPSPYNSSVNAPLG